MRKKRHEKILEIINEEAITTQEELLKKLDESGLLVTQATISRDIKYLRLAKTLDRDGVYRYMVLKSSANEEISQKFFSFLTETVTDLEVVENIICIKCYTGMASATCATFDAMEFKDVAGTIAGDDTIFILLRNEESAKDLESMMLQYLNE